MLDLLRRITQAVNAAASLDEALELIVSRVKQAMEVDVCSVYLTDEASGSHTLMATDGLNREAIGKVVLARNDGLVGLVAERQEPVNLDAAADHPRFHYFPETGEERYNAFLGVPIINYRRDLGILVVQHLEARRFSNDESAFLVTIAAQLAGAVAYALETGKTQARPAASKGRSDFHQGVPGAPGVAVGSIVLLSPLADLDSVPDREVDDVVAEERAFLESVAAVQAELRSDAERLSGALTSDAKALFDVHVMLLGDDSLLSGVVERIRAGNWAPGALRETVREHVRVFDQMDDAYLRARAEDVRDVGRRLLVRLQSIQPATRKYPKRCILMADEVSIAHIADVPLSRIAGIVSMKGSRASHVAVLAGSLGVPAVMGLGKLPVEKLDGERIVINGYKGQVCIDPTPLVIRQVKRLVKQEKKVSKGLEALRGLPAQTTDGSRVLLYVNNGLMDDIVPPEECGAEGVGLYRTEHSFLSRKSLPTEDEQYQIYRKVLQTYAPSHVVIRTLDVGGDKPLPYLPIEEENPFLGWRGIRITLDHPEIFLIQLRALLRANEGLNNLHLLLPMVSSIAEVDSALELLDRAHEELEEEGFHLADPPVGVMIEVPAMLYQVEALLRRVDFLSLGTNDLTQYLLAVDRNNARVSQLYDSLHPSVLRVLSDLVDTAHRFDKPVSVCGEMAGDPAAVPLLVGMGVDILSMSPASLSRVKSVIRSLSRRRSEELLHSVLGMEDARKIRDFVNDELDAMNLGGLVRAGR
jgi:phosphotransferase system enzyme I (PtsP)